MKNTAYYKVNDTVRLKPEVARTLGRAIFSIYKIVAVRDSKIKLTDIPHWIDKKDIKT